MHAFYKMRRKVLGQSFGTCLLIIVLVFGGIGTYYFKVFQWRDLEEPLERLVIVKKVETSQVTFFRQKTLSDAIDPALGQYKRLVELRKESNKGTVTPEDWQQSKTEINNRLLELMNQAKLKRIPVELEKPYKKVLLGISDIYHSVNSLNEAINSEEASVKKSAYEKSLKYSKSARVRLEETRPIFYK